jgi:hypothetical protein
LLCTYLKINVQKGTSYAHTSFNHYAKLSELLNIFLIGTISYTFFVHAVPLRTF